jgi:hypothetical protein
MMRAGNAAVALQFANVAYVDEDGVFVAKPCGGLLRRDRDDLRIRLVDELFVALLHRQLSAFSRD